MATLHLTQSIHSLKIGEALSTLDFEWKASQHPKVASCNFQLELWRKGGLNITDILGIDSKNGFTFRSRSKKLRVEKHSSMDLGFELGIEPGLKIGFSN